MYVPYPKRLLELAIEHLGIEEEAKPKPPEYKPQDHHKILARYDDRPQKTKARLESRATENIEKNNGGNA